MREHNLLIRTSDCANRKGFPNSVAAEAPNNKHQNSNKDQTAKPKNSNMQKGNLVSAFGS